MQEGRMLRKNGNSNISWVENEHKISHRRKNVEWSLEPNNHATNHYEKDTKNSLKQH